MTSPTSECVSQAETAAAAGPRPKPNKSKRDQLLALVAKQGGMRISVLAERLGWQPHTVRAALSGLRKHGYVILATKAPKTGEAVYHLVKPTQAVAAITSPEGEAA